MMSGDTPFFKNPYRKLDNENMERRHPVPEYVKHGIIPTQLNFKGNVSSAKPKETTDSFRNNQSGLGMALPYAEEPSAVSSGPIPNVGNNYEQTWAGVDGEIVDDINIDRDAQMIDNNDYVEISAYENDEVIKEDAEMYVLLVENDFIASGSMEDIVKEAEYLLIGQHEYCDGKPVGIASLSIYKKMTIKFGLYVK